MLNRMFFAQNVSAIIPTANTYGRLYNYYAAYNVLNLAPVGWRCPTNDDYYTLLGTYDGGFDNSVIKLVFSGFRDAVGVFDRLTTYGYYAATEGGFAQYWAFRTNFTVRKYFSSDKRNGFSVRWIKEDSINTGSVTDIDGNVYSTALIGSQVWTLQNCKVTKYRDGTPIPNVTDSATWASLTTGAMCAYNNDENNV